MRDPGLKWHMGGSGLIAVLIAAACSAGLGSSKSDALGNDTPTTGGGSGAFANEGAGGSSAGGGLFLTADAGLPPEHEASVSFQLPAAGQHYVYVANPSDNTVSVIDAKSLAIQTVKAGSQPTYLQSLGGMDAAIVLNVGSSDATIVRTANGASTTSTVPVQAGSNAIAVAPDGAHAIVYYDPTVATANGASGSVQDVSVVSLAPGNDQAVDMTVGFQPSAVFFSSDGLNGYVVTQDGVSILNFASVTKNGSGIANTVSLGDSASATLDVSITNDGQYAVARDDTTSELRLVTLATGQIQRLDLATVVGNAKGPPADAGAASDGGSSPDAGGTSDAGPVAPVTPPPPTGPITVTDVDLAPPSPYAMSAYAIAAVRELSAAVRIPIPDGFSNPSLVTVTRVPGEVIGSVTLSPGGQYALLYTTASDTIDRLTILDLGPGGQPRSYQLRKAIDAVAISPDDATAFIVHKKLAGDPNEPGIDPVIALERQYGYSVVQLSTGFAKLEVTATALGPSTIVPDSSELFILFNAPGISEVQEFGLGSFVMNPIELGSPPTSVGAVPSSNRVFVGQDHPDGRISFIDWTTATVQSVTGFELNSRIVE